MSKNSIKYLFPTVQNPCSEYVHFLEGGTDVEVFSEANSLFQKDGDSRVIIWQPAPGIVDKKSGIAWSDGLKEIYNIRGSFRLSEAPSDDRVPVHIKFAKGYKKCPQKKPKYNPGDTRDITTVHKDFNGPPHSEQKMLQFFRTSATLEGGWGTILFPVWDQAVNCEFEHGTRSYLDLKDLGLGPPVVLSKGQVGFNVLGITPHANPFRQCAGVRDLTDFQRIEP